MGTLLLKQRLSAHSSEPRKLQAALSSTGIQTISEDLSQKTLRKSLRQVILPVEFLLHLRWRSYDLIWTQWPDLGAYGSHFWSMGHSLGMRVIHTVHNVLPHEENDVDLKRYAPVYYDSERLIVHSEFSKQELSRHFPGTESKSIVALHGSYTMFSRIPESRPLTRSRLGIDDHQIALLFFGGVRPYKNIDSILSVMADSRMEQVILIVAGRESGYADLDPNDSLGRTRRIAQNLGISDRVRFIPGILDLQETSEVFEASDLVVLPYRKSYGSGLLLLGMTFQKFIAATETGGMDEYLCDYPEHLLLQGPETPEVLDGLLRAVTILSSNRTPKQSNLDRFQWKQIAQNVLSEL
jgi:glycosyltransferase involved in cell wall biosynthesis